MSELVSIIRERYLRTLGSIKEAAQSVGRDPNHVSLVVVTKSQPVDVVQAAIEAGARILGENYADEGVMKLQSLRQYNGVEWHMIGHVQSRKAQQVAENFNYLHSLDSLKLARKLDGFCRNSGKTLSCFLEFNVGDEGSKSGWAAWHESNWSAFQGEISEILELPNLKIQGLMAMPPLGETAEFSRPFFQKLKRLQVYLIQQFPHADLSGLSMGTSSDYQIAVQEGATMVRVGTAILGARRYKTEDK
jgi:pyridoxal phosphate enzyme (YggS family)